MIDGYIVYLMWNKPCYLGDTNCNIVVVDTNSDCGKVGAKMVQVKTKKGV